MRFEIEPKIGLGNFILGMNINQVLTLIKRNGYYYKHCKLISNKEKNTPIFLEIPSESITLRFNYYTQNLELIEKRIIIDNDANNKNSSEANADSEYYYKNKLFYMQNKNKEFHIIKYQNIAQLFGLSKVPKKLNKNKNIFLEYSGIGFYFTNIIDLEKSEDLDISSDPSSVDTNSVLSKFFIFKEDSLYDSLNTKNIFETNDILIKYDTKKGKSIKIKRNNDNSKGIISIGDDIEDVLRELKNPNYIYYANDINDNYNQVQDNGNIIYNQTSNKMFYLNYFKYGFDIMICNNKVNRIILHTNYIGDSKFGVYERCNFKLKLRKDYLSTLVKIDNKIDEKKEEININNKKEQIPNKEIKEKRKNDSRKNSENENIKAKDKKNIKQKDEKNDLTEANLNNKNIKENEKGKENNIKEKEQAGENKQVNSKNINDNVTEDNKNIKNEQIENKEIKNEKKLNKIKLEENLEEKKENQNEKNKKDEKINNSERNDQKEKEEKEEKEKKKKEEKEKKEKEEKEKKEKEEKEKKEKEEREKKEKEEREKEEKLKKEKEENEKKEKEEKEKKEKEEKEEEKKEEEKEEQKNEEENKQSQKNNYTSSKNNRRRRKKHSANPPKRKNEITKEENEESENEEESNKTKEKETKIKENNENNISEEYIEIFPWTDFKQEFLSKIEYNKNLRHQKWDEGTSKIINCYFFNGLLFEIVDKNVIGTVIIY